MTSGYQKLLTTSFEIQILKTSFPFSHSSQPETVIDTLTEIERGFIVQGSFCLETDIVHGCFCFGLILFKDLSLEFLLSYFGYMRYILLRLLLPFRLSEEKNTENYMSLRIIDIIGHKAIVT